MSATVPDEVLAAGETPPDGRSSWRTVRTMLAWLLSFAGLAVVVGFLSGVFWWGVVDLPTYTIGEDFRGYTTERALTEERPFRGVAAEVFADRVGREIDDAPPEH